MVDCVIIGAGVVGCCTAQMLAQYQARIVVLEAKSDVAEGTSKANSAIVHAGYDAKPHTKKALYNVRGNAMYEDLCARMDVHFKRNGSLVLCFDAADWYKLEELKQRGEANGVQGLRLIERRELLAMEPYVSDQAVGALFAPTGAITCPYGLTEALAENACANGAQFYFDCPVQAIERTERGFCIHAGDRHIETRCIVNAAGVHVDEIACMIGAETVDIQPRKGEYCIFDKTAGALVQHTLFQLPGAMGKGVLVTPTVDGNLMVGPNANDQDSKEDVATTGEGLAYILQTGGRSVQGLPRHAIITSFAGLRAHSKKYDDFYIGQDANVKGFFHAAGIESPGLTAAPAIAEDLSKEVAAYLQCELKENPIRTRRGIARFDEMTEEEQDAAIAKNPLYAQIICRCETVTEAEVVDAIHRTPGATTIDGIKRRTRCGMGRCQGGFCMPKVAAILERELGIAPERVTKKGGSSTLTVGPMKEDAPCVQ